MSVADWRPELKFVPAVIVAALIVACSTVVVAPPVHALPPVPRPHPPLHPPPVRPPAVHPMPHLPEAGPTLDDGIPEVRPSNDPNEYEPPVLGVPQSVAPRSTPQPANDGDSWDDATSSDASPGDDLSYADVGDSTGADEVTTGTSQDVSDGDNSDNGLDFKSIGLIGGVLVSGTSLVMWLTRRT
jgi:hypothetical protein